MSSSANFILYRAAFIRNCHTLIARGYSGLSRASFRDQQETEITGELIRSIKDVLQRPDSPTWMDRFFVADDPPVNASGRKGKSRRRVDIEIERGEHGPRPRLQFEAKRLYSGSPVSEYLGADGMLLFISGEHAAGQIDGGMLGYVQEGTSGNWAAKIAEKINGDVRTYRVIAGGEFAAFPVTAELDSTHRSAHRRSKHLEPITIHHTLLMFC
jgi:hypothetical protein